MAISTNDIDRVSAFYVELLGFERIHELSWSGAPEVDAVVGLNGSAARMILLSAGNQCLELFEYSSPPPGRADLERPVCRPGYSHIAVAVRDIDREYERLAGAGMRFHCPPTRGGALRVTYGRDPEGNIVELLEILGDHPFAYRPSRPDWRSGVAECE